MTIPIDDLIRRCQAHRDAGAKEKKLREEFVSHLRRVFPHADDQTWIDHYIEGAETTQRGPAGGARRATVRFVDTLVRATVMEYEPDIRNRATYEHGKSQVQEYAANLIRDGTPAEQVRGVLTDFVKWEVYSVRVLRVGAASDTIPEDIELITVDQFDTTRTSAHLQQQFIAFIKSHLAREGSRAITPEHLIVDLGMRSRLFGVHASALLDLVRNAREGDQSVKLATGLWARFIDHLETGGSSFRATHYAAELYFAIVARLLSANVLCGVALRSDTMETGGILNGTFFANRFRLSNFVERDYFGWIGDEPHLSALIPLAQRIQLDLTAYDFTRLPTTEVFGPLIGQLGQESQRHLLGQATTPQWLAQLLAERALDNLPQGTVPHFVDMCCGSGAIIAECLKAIIRRAPKATIEELAECVTGFDVDPVAVSFAKTTWVLTLRDHITRAKHAVTIPIYHADSLFVASPTAKGLPRADTATDIQVDLDDHAVKLPAVLIQPEFRQVFDDLVDWAYDGALRAAEIGNAAHITPALASQRLTAALADHSVTLDKEAHVVAQNGLFSLAARMAQLAMDHRNGIWAFILKNTYRPSLLAGQFNGIVSNPPWLALSKIANNPYKDRIGIRTDAYGLRPTGPSFLHLEIATTFLVYAVDRYLAPGGQIAVLLPGTLVNGDHHQPFRSASYQSASRRISFQIAELWDVAKETFKAPCVCLVGQRTDRPGTVDSSHTAGFKCDPTGCRRVGFSVHTLGKRRTAWSISDSETGTSTVTTGLVPNQGADLMPRTAVCVSVLNRTGTEWKVETPTTTGSLSHVVADSKKMKTSRFNGYVAPRFIHGMLQSKGLVPFAFDPRLPSIALPVLRREDRTLVIVSDAEIRALGFRNTANRFALIERAYADEGIDKEFRDYIDERGKLLKQTFPESGFLILTAPGGSNTAAAMFELVPGRAHVLVDQTLYWYWLESQTAADYYVGMFNSGPLAKRIDVFIPKGVFGRRHLHTVPWQVTPEFESRNPVHRRIAELSGVLRAEVAAYISTLDEMADPGRWLKTGRSLIREWLSKNKSMHALNAEAAKVLASAKG